MNEPKPYRSGKRRGYYADWTDSTGKRHRKRFSGPLAYDQARRWIDRVTAVEGAGDGSMAISRLAAEYLREIESTGKVKPSTAKNYRQYLKVWAAFCHEHNLNHARQVSRIHLDSFAGWFFRQPSAKNNGVRPGAATYNRYIRGVSAFYSWLVSRQHIEVNPFVGAGRVMAKESTAPIRYFEKSELTALLDFWDRENGTVALCFRLMAFTGARVEEVRRLCWEDIDLNHRLLTYCRDTKNWKPRTIPIGRSIVAILRPLKQKSGQVIDPSLTQNGLNKRLARSLRILGLPKRNLRAFRATAATTMFAEGGDAISVMTILGHSEIKTTMRYAAAVPHRMRELMEKVSE